MAFAIVALSLGGVYALAALAALTLSLRLHCIARAWTMQKRLLILMLLVAAGRCAFFFLIAHESPPQLFADLLQLRYASVALYVLDEAPGLFFFTTYAALLWSWADIYHTARDTTRTLKIFVVPCLGGSIGLLYTVQILLWVGYAVLKDDAAAISFVSACVMLAGLLTVGLGMAVYGRQMYKMIREVPISVERRRAKLSQIVFTTVVCTVLFFARAAAVTLAAVADHYNWRGLYNQPAPIHTAVIVGYFVLLEIVPVLFLAWQHRRLPPRQVHARPLNTSGSYSGASPDLIRTRGPSRSTGPLRVSGSAANKQARPTDWLLAGADGVAAVQYT